MAIKISNNTVIDDSQNWTGNTIPVNKGGTGATTLSGVLIGNGTGAVTTKTNPAGDLVGTTDAQTLTNKTISMSGLLQLDQSSNIVAAATTNLGTATGNAVTVTHAAGALAITSFGGASLQSGTELTITWSVSGTDLTVTNNATSLILPSAANLPIADGDVWKIQKISDSQAYWRVVDVTKADGTPANQNSTQTVYLPASALLPTITNGATPVYSETTTNKNIISGLAFDAATQEHAQFSIVMPKSWNLGTVAAKFHWKHGATTTNFGVTWALEAVAVGNDDTLDVAFGTEQIVSDVGGTTDDLYTTASTPAITIAGTPAEGDYVNFRVYRDVADAGDTLAVDAVLLGITLLYGTVSNSDA